MNILMVIDPDGYPEMQNSITKWFSAAEHSVEYIDKADSFDENYMLRITEIIKAADIKAVFTAGFETQYSLLCGVMNIRYICWLPYDGRGQAYSYAVRNPWNRIFTADPVVFACLKDNDCADVSFLPLGFERDKISETQGEPSKDIILWSEGGRDYLTVNSVLNGLKDASKGYIDALLQAMRADLDLSSFTEKLPQYVLDDLKSNVDHSENSLMDFAGYCDHVLFFPAIDKAMSYIYFHMLFSNSLVQEAAFAMEGDLPYTNKEFERVTRTDIRESGYARLDEYKIVIFFTPYSEDGVISMDLWNIMAKGAFVLVSANTDLSPLGENAPVTFRSTWDLEEKVRFYLKHDKERREKAVSVRKKVLEFGAFESRLESIFGGE